jgi:electron transport complex protein RnfG
MMFKNSIVGRSALTLTLFGIVGAGLVSLTFLGTADQIAENERQALLKSLNAIVPAEVYDNSIEGDVYSVFNEDLLGPDPVTIYRARKNGNPVAAVLTPVAPDGFSGKIRLLVGIDYQGAILGVRVIAHNETPGLGDKIDARRDDWIFSFNGLSLTNPAEAGWKVKKDGGIFDQFTGATITPRAVVKAVHKSLKFYVDNRDTIFSKNVQ